MRVRLRATGGGKTKTSLQVVRTGEGSIRGVSLARLGPALGHGFELDKTSLEQIAQLADGAKARWTHGEMCADGIGTHLGRFSSPRLSADGLGVDADFTFSPTAPHVQPEGLAVDARTYLLDAAEKEPDTIGLSVVLEGLTLEDLVDGDGKPMLDAQGDPRRAARVTGIPRADFTGDPAANPAGLFAGVAMAALSEGSQSVLAGAVEAYGAGKVRGVMRAWLAANPEPGGMPPAGAPATPGGVPSVGSSCEVSCATCRAACAAACAKCAATCAAACATCAAACKVPGADVSAAVAACDAACAAACATCAQECDAACAACAQTCASGMSAGPIGAKLASHEALIVDLRTKLSAAEAILAQAKAADVERALREDAAYVEELARESAALQAPILEADLATVREQLAAGNKVAARAIGSALLGAAQARAGKPVALRKPLAPPKVDEHQLSVMRGQMASLRAQGYVVTPSEDGTTFTFAAPAAGKKG